MKSMRTSTRYGSDMSNDEMMTRMPLMLLTARSGRSTRSVRMAEKLVPVM